MRKQFTITTILLITLVTAILSRIGGSLVVDVYSMYQEQIKNDTMRQSLQDMGINSHEDTYTMTVHRKYNEKGEIVSTKIGK